MKRLIALFCLALLAPGASNAGDIYVPAEVFVFGSGDKDCTRENVVTGYTEYNVIRCLDAGSDSVLFVSHVSFPSDAGIAWTYEVEYETDDPNVSDVCAWLIQAQALPPDATGTVAVDAFGVDISGTNSFSDGNNRHVTTVGVATDNVLDGRTPATDCTVPACANRDTRVIVQLNRVTTTADSCDFRKLHIRY